MQRFREYFAHAETCRSLAARTKDAERKRELLELAAKWALIADERERLLETRKRLEQLPIATQKNPPEHAAPKARKNNG